MDIMLNTVKGQWEILKGSVALLFVTLGESLMPVIKSLMQDHIIPLVNRIQEWASEMGGIVGIMKAVRDAIKSWAADYAGLAKAIEAVWEVVKGLGSALGNFVKGDWSAAWQGMKDAALASAQVIAGIGEWIWDKLPIPDSIKQGIEKAFSAIVDFAKTAFGNTLEFAKNTWSGIKDAISAFASGDWKSGWDSLKNIAASAWDLIADTARSAVSAIKNVIGPLWDALPIPDSIRDGITEVFSVIVDAVKKMWESVKGLGSALVSFAKGDWSAGWQGMKDAAVSAAQAIAGIGEWIWDKLPIPDNIKQGIEKTLSAIIESVKRVWDALSGLVAAVANAVHSIISLFRSMGNDTGGALQSVTNLIVGLTNAVTSLINFLFANEARTKAVLAAIATGFTAIVAVKISAWVTGAMASFGAMGAGLAASGPIGLAVAGFALLVYGIVTRLKEAREAAAYFREKMTETWAGIAASNVTLQQSFDSLGTQLERFATERVKNDVIGALEDLRRKVLDAPVDEMAAAWERGVDEIVAKFGKLSPEVEMILNAFKPELLRQGQEMAQEVAEGIERGSAEVEASARRLGEAIEAGLTDSAAGVVCAADMMVGDVELSF
jgi:phage-related protein